MSERTFHRILNRNHGQQDTPRAYASKPDPDEPWRYVCPDCGGHVHADFTMRSSPYRCGRCYAFWDRDELHDKKTEGEVLPSV